MDSNASFNKPPGSQSDPFYDLLQPTGTGSTNFVNSNASASKNADFIPSFDSNGADYNSNPSQDYSNPNLDNHYNNYSSNSSSRNNNYPSETMRSPIYAHRDASNIPNPRIQVQEDNESFDQGTAVAVEQIMKKYADKLLKVLEGMSGRLQHVESTTVHLESVLGKLQQSVSSSNGEIDGKVRNLENIVKEIQRSVQVIRDKQEIAEAQAELTKLSLQASTNSTNQPPQTSSQTSTQPPPTSVPAASIPVPTPPTPIASAPPVPAPSLPVPSPPAPVPLLPAPVPAPSAPVAATAPVLPSAPSPVPNPAPVSMPPAPMMTQQAYFQAYSEMNQAVQSPAPSDPSAPHHTGPIASEPPYMHTVPTPTPKPNPQYQPPMNVPQMYASQPTNMPPQQPNTMPLSHQMQYPSVPVPNMQRPSAPMHEPQPHTQKPPQSMNPYLQLEGPPPPQYSTEPPPYMQNQSSYPNPPTYPPASMAEDSDYGSSNRFAQSQYSVPQMDRPNRTIQSGMGQGYEPIQRSVRPPSSQLALPAPYPSAQPVGHGSDSYDNNAERSNAGMYGRESPQYRLAQPVPNREVGGGGGYPKLPLAQPVQRSSDTFSSPLAREREGGTGQPLNSSRIPVEKVIEDVANMGFSREQVRSVVRKLTENGQSVDLNTVLDKLMNGDRGGRDNKGWFGRG